MARLFGYFANQSDRIRCALALESEALAIEQGIPADGWGVGSYQGGEVLLRRRPTEPRERVNLRDLVRDLRTDCALVHIRSATAGAHTLENTPPFRYRQWLFAHTGSVPGFAALRSALMTHVPDFLARNVHGETDSEVFFHLFLAMVHKTGRLDDPELDRWSMVSALREALALMDQASSQAGQPPAMLNCIVTHGTAMVALRRGLPMFWHRRSGLRDCAACRRQPDVTGREPKRVDHETFKYVLVASAQDSTPRDWYDLPDVPGGALLAIDRTLDAQVVQF